MCACRASYLQRRLMHALLFLAALLLPVSGDCPKSCACNGPAEVHCTFRYLTTVPDHIQPAVERINLGYNSITALKEHDLSGLENLELLMLHSNTIHSIEDRAFQDLKSLQVLKISFNKVKEINKDTFRGLGSIQRLHLDHNNIAFISPEAFYGLTRLQLVQLEGNHLQQLHPDTFITLRYSQVFKVSSVRGIHLSENLLTTLPAEIFSGCGQLENLFLHGNPWACDCRMKWFSEWTQKNTGVLKCRRDRRYPRGQLCPVCENPAPLQKRPLSLLSSDAFTCSKPWIQSNLKQRNISLDEGDFTPVSPKDFIAPLGSIQMNLTDQFHSDASLSCTVQSPSDFDNLSQTLEVDEGNNVTVLNTGITSYLVCNVDHEHIQPLWQILASYSDSPLRLERGPMLTRSPEMIYRYSQINTEEEEDGIHTSIVSDIKASPAWLMQGEVHFQLDRTMTTFSTLHIKYQSEVNLRMENKSPTRDRYSWTMIKRDNQTKTEHTLLTGGVAQLNCQIRGEPKPLLEWILPDGSKVRAPFSSEDSRILINADGKLTLRGADVSDAGVYRCIATNYLDADILIFRVTVLSPDVEESEVNGVQLTKPQGDDLMLDCSSSGSPKASAQWILPDHSVLDKTQGKRKVFDNGTLLIQGLTERDRGFYRCLVANDLGVDLLVSQVTLTEARSSTVTLLDNKGSGSETEDSADPSLTEHPILLEELPSSSPYDRTSQESRTITSDRPYPRLRSHGRGLGQRRRGHATNRHIWNSRVFDKTSRKVDPKKFAEFMKKAQHGSRTKTRAEDVKDVDSNTGLSGDGENGSGEDHEEDQLIVMSRIPSRDDQERRTPGITETTPTTESYMLSDSPPVKSTFLHNPTERIETQSDAATPYFSHDKYETSDEDTELYMTERTTRPGLIRHPVTVQLAVTESSQETQLQFSGEPAEPETATGTALLFTTDPNVTPMRDGTGPVEFFVHTSEDPESQTTFTAITTTERQQDEITLHTTQTIKSPRLPAGSTIISRQHIHIIPNKGGRGGGRRRTFQGRRRIVKPNRITDIQSIISRLRQPGVKKEGSATVPYKIELSTDCNCDDNKNTSRTHLQEVTPTGSFSSTVGIVGKPAATPKPVTSSTFNHMTTRAPFRQQKLDSSNGYITSADAPDFYTTVSPFWTTRKKPVVSTTAATTTTASKVIRGRIPWDRLFGGRDKDAILGRLKKPFNTPKTSTTAEPTTVTLTTTPAAVATTPANSLAEPETLSPSVYAGSKEGSIDDDYESSTDLEIPTLEPRVYLITTTSSPYYGRSSTTAETPPESQTLPSPPTIQPPSKDITDEDMSSGSGGLPDNWFVGRKRPDRTRGQQGRRRRPFGGRRPFKRPVITKPQATTTTEVITTVVTTIETTMETTRLPQRTVSIYKPLFTPTRTEDRTPTSVSTIQREDSHEESDWDTDSSLHTTTKAPFVSQSTQTTTSIPATTERPLTTAQPIVHSHAKPPVQRGNGGITPRTPISGIRPTMHGSDAKHDSDKSSGEEVYTNSPISNVGATRANIPIFEATTRVMTSKPKIVGGNAASFTVLSNSDAFLPCEVMGNPQPTITWRRLSSSTGSTFIIQGKMGKFEVLPNGTLSIQNASVKDRGQYLCLAENEHGTDKLLVALSVVAYPSRILEPKIRDIKSHAGNTVEMKCKAEGRPMPLISWILANRTQVRGQNPEKARVSVTSEGTLIIEQVSVYDRGHYKCIASNPAGADTATVRLQVVAAPPGIKEEKRQQVEANAGQSLWIPCTGHGSPFPALHWVLNDGSVLQSNKFVRNSRISVYINGTLLIKDVTPANNGKYECIATSSTGSERRVVTLIVKKQETAPHIVETSQRMTELFYGDQLVLNCSAMGDPKPRVMWRLPSKAVVDQWHRMGSRIKVLENGTLIVSAVSDKDAGEYLCVARSSIGDALQFMRVSVTMKPAKIEPKLYGKTQVPYGKDLKVDCKASGAPKPEISWGLPDGTVVNSALQSDASSVGGRARRYTLFDNGTLYLNQVGMSEEGDYTCYAENKGGKDEMHVHISVVTAAPRIIPASQTYARVRPGGNVRFDCAAFGEPRPKILWMLPNNDVIGASNERYLMHVNGSLDIRDVKLIDNGEYICIARNLAGEHRNVYKLDIDGNPPVINGFRQNRTVVKDVAAKFSRKFMDCKAEGNPTPTVTWLMPDNIFLKAPYFGSRINVHLNGTLEIRNVRPTDTAEFICMARNDGGEAVMVVQLEVTSMLQRPIFKNPFNERIVSRFGKTTLLNCSADGRPTPEITWTFPNGTRVTAEQHHDSQHHLSSDGTLVIYNPGKEDAGKYRCGAKNFLGYIEKLIILDIGQKPYILTRPRGIIRSMSGEALFLHCLSDGNPRPRIYWTIPRGHTLTRPQVFGRYQLLENGTLVVQDTTLHDRGNYICRARNDAGEALLTVPVLIIAYPPRITTAPPPHVRALTGAPVQLNCAATGIPKPEITWELPDKSVLSAAGQGRPSGSELLHPQGTLIIQRPVFSDSGTYKCLAKNNLGTDSKVTYVHVL